MSDWQPIATAPKDGTTILIWCPKPILAGNRPYQLDEHVALASWSNSGFGGDHWQGLDGDIDSGYESTGPWFEHEAYAPTHWMPLPAPPGADPGIPILRSTDATDQVMNDPGVEKK